MPAIALGLSPDAIWLVALAFLLAGFVKGVVGGGLPAVAVPIMATVVEPALAAAITAVSVILTNVWLVTQGGLMLEVARRYWPLLLALSIGSGLGAQLLVSLPPEVMKLAIGILVIVLSPLPFLPQSFGIPVRAQPWLNPLAGMVMGVVGGATAMLAPMILYLVALRVEKDLFVASLGAIALAAMIPLFIGLAASRVLGQQELLASALAFAPAAVGMAAGIWLRGRISQQAFRVVLSVALFAVGLNLVWRTLLAGLV